MNTTVSQIKPCNKLDGKTLHNKCNEVSENSQT